MSKCIYIAIIFVAFSCLYAGEGEDFFPPVAVSEEHKVLTKGVGEWTIEQKHWDQPGAEPIISAGTCVCRSILEGRATTVEVHTKNAYGDFKGFGVFTWNVTQKKYSASWVDGYSYNGIDSMDGSYDAKTQTMTWTSMMTMPDGTKFPFRMVEKFIDNDKFVAEFYMPMGDKDFKMMENTYTRAKTKK